MTIKRTAYANTPRGAAWVASPWQEGAHGFADQVHAEDYPTHSPVLGANGQPLEYEPRQPLGFDLSGRRQDG